MWRNVLGAQSSRDHAATCLPTAEAVPLGGSLLSHTAGRETCVPIALTEDWTIGFRFLGYATQSAGYFTVHEVAASSTKRLLPHKTTCMKNLVESQSNQVELVFDHKSDGAEQP